MRTRTGTLALLLACGVLAAVAALAEDGQEGESDHDQDRAFEALQRGEIMPLDKVLAGLGARHPGELVGVELERREGRWVYEVRLLDGSGRLIDLDIDAQSGKVIRPEGK
jgi:uncharacterized membrane protein YkoI